MTTQRPIFDPDHDHVSAAAEPPTLMVRERSRHYRPAAPDEIFSAARHAAHSVLADRPCVAATQRARAWCAAMLCARDVEVFAVLALDNQHCVVAYDELFRGTVAECAVYPREVLQLLLRRGATAAIITHNHPSGNPQFSEADKRLTHTLRQALELVDIRLLDHILVAGGETVSFAEAGLL
ncbi:DNA repair protein radC-like protein [Bordetella ansorpii]|uniref:DNA repair protein radC-like protein n=1 Tax=Bordetella ansorpii TaxID=288768 RepID=A0A157SS30_9BORD|nr:JAB domain-containing protein [Bordetella ansorpii]SAI73114.1 DNA repair protein radC-like protein [Bordetella ansorpii]